MSYFYGGNPGAGAAYYGGFCNPSPNLPMGGPGYPYGLPGAGGNIYNGAYGGGPYGYPYGYPYTAGAAYMNGFPTANYAALYGGNGFGLGASYPLADPISGYGSYGGFMTNGAYVMSNGPSAGGAPAPRMMMAPPPGPPVGSGVNLAPLGKTV